MKADTIKPVTMTVFLAVAVVCLMLLSVLSLSSAAADKRLAQRYADALRQEYALEAEGQKYLSQLDLERSEGALPPGIVEKTIGKPEERHIKALIQVEEQGYRLLQWQCLPPETGEKGMENLWRGE